MLIFPKQTFPPLSIFSKFNYIILLFFLIVNSFNLARLIANHPQIEIRLEKYAITISFLSFFIHKYRGKSIFVHLKLPNESSIISVRI